MTEYEFELNLKLRSEENGEDYVDSLFEAGCDDALVGVGKPGFIGLDFAREADSAYEAISSAIKDVRKAIPHARLIEVGPDLMGLSDMGSFFNVSRQYMRHLIVGSPDAPFPVHSGGIDIWRFLDVVSWMHESRRNINGKPIGESLLELATITMNVNLAKDQIRWALGPFQMDDPLSNEENLRALTKALSPRIRELFSEEDIRHMA